MIILWQTRNWHIVENELGHLYWSPIVIQQLANLPFGWNVRPSIAFVDSVYFVALLSGGLALVGFLTNFTLFIFTLACVYVQSFIYSFGDYHHREAAMMIALGVLALSPSGKVLSIDWMIKRRRHTVSIADEGKFAGWAIKLIGWFFVLMYLSAAYCKLRYSGLEWANGFTLQYYLANDGLASQTYFGAWLSQYHVVVMVFQIFTLIFEATFAAVMILPWTRRIYVPLGLMFHVGILLTMNAPFFQWIALYAVFVNWSAVFRWLAPVRSRAVAVVGD